MANGDTPAAFFEKCIATLSDQWLAVGDRTDDYLEDASSIRTIKELMQSRTKSYRYVLPTQILAKVVDPSLDCRCIQAGPHSEPERFDARSLCTKVIVPFENAEGKPLGGSPDPYVNNPLRDPEVSPEYRGNKSDKNGWDKLYTLLTSVQEANDPDFTLKVFRQVLLEIKRIQSELNLSYPVPRRISISGAQALLSKFLAPRTGGRRLQAITIAVFETMKRVWDMYDSVKSAPVNVSDTSTDRAADIECQIDGETVLAIEVKDRTLTLELLSNQISSARIAKVTELLFIIRATPITEGPQVLDAAAAEYGSGLNIYFLDADVFFESILVLLGEKGRYVFLEQVGSTLEEYNLDFSDRRDWAELLTRNWQ